MGILVRPLTPQLDIPLVLCCLAAEPFKPVDQIPLERLSTKMALLLALTSAKHASYALCLYT